MSEELISKYDIRGTEESGLTLECAWNIGKALADWLTTNGDIVVMYMPMQSDTARAVIEGLRLQGRNVIDGGSGDKEAAKSYISSVGLSGAVVIGYDDTDKVIVIELYKEDSSRIEMESGLKQIRELVLAGNFVPAAVKGELTHLV
jgi:phosphomannomutase